MLVSYGCQKAFPARASADFHHPTDFARLQTIRHKSRLSSLKSSRG
jgi:hypothetical protein